MYGIQDAVWFKKNAPNFLRGSCDVEGAVWFSDPILYS